jgi:hypothetical protein
MPPKKVAQPTMEGPRVNMKCALMIGGPWGGQMIHTPDRQPLVVAERRGYDQVAFGQSIYHPHQFGVGKRYLLTIWVHDSIKDPQAALEDYAAKALMDAWGAYE